MQLFEQEQGDQDCPNLDAERVLTGAGEGLGGQILFQGLKEQLSGKGLARYRRLRPVSSPSP